MGARVKLNPSTRTMAYLEARGWMVEDVERRERRGDATITYDAFGCYDILAINTDGQPLLVQCTSLPNLNTRVKKCRANTNTGRLLVRGVRCEVWGWSDKADPKVVALSVAEPPR